jgi:two-component system sensor histidine kinase KdpD
MSRGRAVARRRPRAPLPAGRRSRGWAVAVLAPVALTLLLLPVRGEIALSSVLLLFLLTVLATASLGGLGPSLLASLMSFVLANWFYTPPLHTWKVDDFDNLLALAVLLMVGCVASWYGATVNHRSAEAERARTATELRTALLAAVSHDLRTPLASIKASVTSLLADDVDWPPDVERQFVLAIDHDADRLTYLVTNLLDMSRLSTGAVAVHRVPVGVEELVLTAVRSLGDRADPGRLDIDVDEALPSVETDPSLVERAIANLVDNALAWSPADRPVRIEASVPAGGSTAPDAAADEVDLLVVDHGPGIPPAERERVFLPFQRHGDRSNGPGVGLGLAVARGMVDAVGGRLAVRDTAGGGTTMVVSLPQHGGGGA